MTDQTTAASVVDEAFNSTDWHHVDSDGITQLGATIDELTSKEQAKQILQHIANSTASPARPQDQAQIVLAKRSLRRMARKNRS